MFELDAIAAAFIGGAAVTGGVGKVHGAIIGGLIMAVMSNGMSIMGIDQSTPSVVRGVVLLIAVAFDVWNKKRSGTGASPAWSGPGSAHPVPPDPAPPGHPLPASANELLVAGVHSAPYSG